MSFTQTDDAALETFPLGFSLSPPVFPAVFFFLTKGDVGSFLLALFHGRQVRNVQIRVSQCWRRNEADVVGLLGQFSCFQQGSGFRFLFMESIPAPRPSGSHADGLLSPFPAFFSFSLHSHVYASVRRRRTLLRKYKLIDPGRAGEGVRGEPSPSVSWTVCHPESPPQPEIFQLFFQIVNKAEHASH